MITIERVLLAKRKDGKFLRLYESQPATGWDYVDEPELAKRVHPHKDHFYDPQPALYYFENSLRAREIWLKDCEMVPYEITTEVKAVAL